MATTVTTPPLELFSNDALNDSQQYVDTHTQTHTNKNLYMRVWQVIYHQAPLTNNWRKTESRDHNLGAI